jgi:L-amino acid N-acyltransferase YncA
MDDNIRPLNPEAWDEVRRIYQQGIDTNIAAFQTSCPACEEWNASHLEICRYVYVPNGRIAGWVALTPVSDRCVYAGVAESKGTVLMHVSRCWDVGVLPSRVYIDRHVFSS